MPLFTIDDTLISVYQEAIDDIINQLGKNCTLILPSKVTPCTNCVFDPITGKSSNVYKIGGDLPFDIGICPLCGGEGNVSQDQSVVVKMTLKWNPRDLKDFGVNVQQPTNVVKSKTFLTNLNYVKNATMAIIDSDQRNASEIICYRVSEPILTGLQTSRYIVTFWERR